MSTDSVWRQLSDLQIPENVHPLISRLPTEILQEIFILCARDYHYQHLCPAKSSPDWINVSYVCPRWRNAALECPILWSYLFITSQCWTEALLARSKQASLKIRVSLIHSPHKSSVLSCMRMVMNHVDRLQELSLRLPPQFIQPILFGLSSRAPRLRVLNIMVEDSSVVWPSSLLDGDPPVLHTLKLVGCPVPLRSFRLGSLTILHLVNVPVLFQQSINEFFFTLSYMQNLRHLHLYHALPSAISFLSSAVFKTFRKIVLVHLSRLWICAPLSTVVTLLSCINIPLETQVRLECLSEPDSLLDHYTRFRSLLAQRYKDQASLIPKILSLVVCPIHRGVMITFSPYERYSFRDSFPMQQQGWDRGIPLYIELGHLTMDKDSIINDICSSMPLSNVQSLVIVRPLFSPDFWRRMLRQLEDVRYIRLFEGNMPDFSVLALTDHMTHDTEGDGVQNQSRLDQVHADRFLAPKLEVLELKEVHFSPEDDDRSNPSEPAITRRCLLDALSTRQGSPGRLTIARCEIPGSGTFHMGGVWGDGGFRIEFLNVFPPEVISEDSEDSEDSEGWGEDDDDSNNNDDDSDDHHWLEQSIHFPVVDA